MNQPLILVDGTAFLFRSYFSTISQNLTNESGFPTGAMFGVVNAIKHLQRKYHGSKLIMILIMFLSLSNLNSFNVFMIGSPDFAPRSVKSSNS